MDLWKRVEIMQPDEEISQIQEKAKRSPSSFKEQSCSVKSFGNMSVLLSTLEINKLKINLL
jgi:hypothetical protein